MDELLDLPLGPRTLPAVIAAAASMVLPPLLGAAVAPSHLTLWHLIPPLVVAVILPWPAVAWTQAATARGRVLVSGRQLAWWYDDRAGVMDLDAPVAVDAWIDERGGDDEIACVVLGLAQGETAVAVAYTIHADHAPDLPRRVGEVPVYLLVGLRPRRALEALERRARAAGP